MANQQAQAHLLSLLLSEKVIMWEYLDELLAVIIVIACLCFIGLGIDGEVKSILTIATGWVFGREFTRHRKRG